MRNYFLVTILIVLLLTSCNNAKKENPTGNDFTTNIPVSDSLVNPLLTEFKILADSCDTTDVNSAGKLTSKFKEIFNGQAQTLCDSAFVIYQNYLDKLDKSLNDSLLNDTTDFSPLFKSVNPPKILKEYRTGLKNNGFRIKEVNSGEYYIEQDRGFISKNLYPLLSDTMRVYLNEIKLENEQGFALDEQIVIRPVQLVDRVLWYDRFISFNPKFIYISDCRNFRKAYLTYLVSGYGKSEVIDLKTNELTPYFNESYTYLLKKYPESETAILLQPYVDALRQKQSDKSAEIRKNLIIKGLIYNL